MSELSGEQRAIKRISHCVDAINQYYLSKGWWELIRCRTTIFKANEYISLGMNAISRGEIEAANDFANDALQALGL